jgi:hypothetical protein
VVTAENRASRLMGLTRTRALGGRETQHGERD